MKRFYVFCGEHEWKIDADKADILEGHLCFFENNTLVAAFNSERWESCEMFKDME